MTLRPLACGLLFIVLTACSQAGAPIQKEPTTAPAPQPAPPPEPPAAGEEDSTAAVPPESDAGLLTATSDADFATTLSRLEKAIGAGGLKVMARFDHAANAKQAGLQLPPRTVLVFGNPEVGTKLMQASATFAIDLPMKALVYEQDGEVLVAINAPTYLGRRHGLDHPMLGKVEGKLNGLLQAAAGGASGG